MTIRDNTERPITVQIGANVIAGTKKENIIKAYSESIEKTRHASLPEKWDGKASERIWKVLMGERCREEMEEGRWEKRDRRRKRGDGRGKIEDRSAGTTAALGRGKLNKFKPHWDRQDGR